MLRELTLLILLLDVALLFFAEKKTAALLVVAVWLIAYSSRRTYSHVIGKELSYLAARLAQILLLLTAAFMLLIMFSRLSAKEVIPFYVASSLALVPSLYSLILQKKITKSESKLGHFRAVRVIRCMFGSASSQIFLILFGIVGVLSSHLLPAVTVSQIIAFQLCLILPLIGLQLDKSPHKLLKATDHNFRSHTISKKALRGYAGYGFLAATLAYINFFLIFTRHNLNPYYLDPSLPLYKQATTLALLTLAVCAFLNIIFERVDKHEFFINEHTLDNKKLIKAFGLSMIILGAVIYVPFIQNVFDTEALDLMDWLSVIGSALVYIAFRMTKRHTRKHSRHAVIKLHKQLNS